MSSFVSFPFVFQQKERRLEAVSKCYTIIFLHLQLSANRDIRGRCKDAREENNAHVLLDLKENPHGHSDRGNKVTLFESRIIPERRHMMKCVLRSLYKICFKSNVCICLHPDLQKMKLSKIFTFLSSYNDTP